MVSKNDVEEEIWDELLGAVLGPRFNHKPLGPPLEELEKESAFKKLYELSNSLEKIEKEENRDG